MKYKTYNELISLVDEFRLEHQNLPDDELDKLVKKIFRIDQPILRELDCRGLRPIERYCSITMYSDNFGAIDC